jgi:hypothetical protein
MVLTWSKFAGEWCLLERVQPDMLDDYGVFVVWRNGDLLRPLSGEAAWTEPLVVKLPPEG